MTITRILCLLLSLFLFVGCVNIDNPGDEPIDEIIEVQEDLIIEMYEDETVNFNQYIQNLKDYYLEDNQKIEELVVGSHEIYLFYHLNNDETLYKQLLKLNKKAVTLGLNVEKMSFNQGNYQIFDEELQAGVLENLDFVNNTLVLRSNQTIGSVTTPVYETLEFSSIVGSWNASTGTGSSVELMVRVRVEGSWSQFFSYRPWSRGGVNYTSNTSDSIAKIDIDMINILKSKYADAFQIKVFLRRNNTEIASPVLKMFSVALDLRVPSTFVCQEDYYKVIDIPKITQMDEPVIGNIICSPTSTTMMLNYLGVNITKGDFARMAKDGSIYGNWSYNVAAASELGVKAYVAKITMEELKNFIAHGQAVVVSVKSSASNPLTGAPMQYTSGHLMVVKGFALINGVEYAVVNDPTDSNVNNVEHYYKVSELNNTWKGYSYIIYK